MPNIVDHVRDLLTEPPKVSHEGRLLHIIPGRECRSCKGTGYVRQHGAPVGRFGPMMNPHCSDCGRDADKWLHHVTQAKFVAAAIKKDPTLLDIV